MNRATRRRQKQARKKLKVGRILSDLYEVASRDWPTVELHRLRRLRKNEALIIMECVRPAGHAVLMIQFLDGRDTAALTWAHLQELKGMCGHGKREAVEIYPADDAVVNVANMRHLWLLPPGQRHPVGLDRHRTYPDPRHGVAGYALGDKGPDCIIIDDPEDGPASLTQASDAGDSERPPC